MARKLTPDEERQVVNYLAIAVAALCDSSVDGIRCPKCGDGPVYVERTTACTTVRCALTACTFRVAINMRGEA